MEVRYARRWAAAADAIGHRACPLLLRDRDRSGDRRPARARSASDGATGRMKYATSRPFADPEVAARKLMETAKTVQHVQDGRIHIEKINGPFLFKEGGSPEEYGSGLRYAIDKGWLWLHESGTYVKFTPAG